MPPRKVFSVLLNLSGSFCLFQREMLRENQVQLKLSKCQCVILLLLKSRTFELLPSIQIQLHAVSVFFYRNCP